MMTNTEAGARGSVEITDAVKVTAEAVHSEDQPRAHAAMEAWSLSRRAARLAAGVIVTKIAAMGNLLRFW